MFCFFASSFPPFLFIFCVIKTNWNQASRLTANGNVNWHAGGRSGCLLKSSGHRSFYMFMLLCPICLCVCVWAWNASSPLSLSLRLDEYILHAWRHVSTSIKLTLVIQPALSQQLLCTFPTSPPPPAWHGNGHAHTNMGCAVSSLCCCCCHCSCSCQPMRAMLKVWPVTGPSLSSESEAERGARSNLSDNLEKNILQINAMMATPNEIWLSTFQLQNAGVLQKGL